MDKFIVIDEDMDFVSTDSTEKGAIREAENVLSEESNAGVFPVFLYELKRELNAEPTSIKLVPNKAKK